jgi:hypothetical protein
MVTIYADAEACGMLQSEVDKAGLGDELAVKHLPSLPPGMIVSNSGLAYQLCQVLDCVAGLRLVLDGELLTRQLYSI